MKTILLATACAFALSSAAIAQTGDTSKQNQPQANPSNMKSGTDSMKNSSGTSGANMGTSSTQSGNTKKDGKPVVGGTGKSGGEGGSGK